MQDHIVAELKPARPTSVPVEVVYSLTEGDYVAYWICLSGIGEMPKHAHKAMRDAVGVCGGLIWVVSIFLAMPLIGVNPLVRTIVLIPIVFGLGFGYAFVLNRIDKKPSTCFQGWLSKPYRWLCLEVLRRLARSEAQDGTLDIQSLHRFAMNAEGFTLTTEPIIPKTDGRSAIREDRVPWPALQEAAFDEDHAFLIVRKGIAVIIPRHGFADAADFDRFVARMQRYRAGTVQPHSSTAIRTLEDRVIG